MTSNPGQNLLRFLHVFDLTIEADIRCEAGIWQNGLEAAVSCAEHEGPLWAGSVEIRTQD
jgi:hypothetical protein